MHITGKRRRRVLLINAVEWSEGYPPEHPLRDVRRWYARRIERVPDVRLRMVSALGDVIRSIRRHADAVIISGSPREAWTDDPLNEVLCAAICECDDLGLPFLGVCYGHQLLGRALGGEVAPHPAGLELGVIPVQLTEPGRHFPLFTGVPDCFPVLLSHVDAVQTLPPRCELLVTGEFCEIQAFHRGGRLMGVQFHPELCPESLRFIWSIRRERWRKQVAFDLDRRLDRLEPTPFSAKILENFVLQFLP